MFKYNYSALFSAIAIALPLTLTAPVASAASAPEVKIGGGLRLNYGWKDYDNDSNGKFEFELFRLDVDISQDEWFVDGQFRWYQGFNSVHHAEVGYRLDSDNTVIAGITQVPFGMEPYGSDSFWFTGAYYLGLEDDYDAGIKWQSKNGNWSTDLAYFFNSEYDNGARYDRYSFDIASVEGKANREDGQLNARVQYKTEHHQVGASLQAGKFINSDSLDKGDHWALGVHYRGVFDSWIVKTQLMHYNYEDKVSLGTADHRIALSAFEYPFDIASEATLASFNLAKVFQINNKFADTVTCYNEYSHIAAADEAGLTDSVQNVTGCNIAKGGLYTYIDWIAGKNMWFVGGPGVGVQSGPDKWRSRLNINIGYYF